MLAGEAKALHTNKRSAGVNTSDPALAAAWEAVRSDAAAETYCLFTYAEGSSNAICLLKCDSGGFEGIASAVRSDVVLFGGMKVIADGQVKFLKLFFVGEDVPGMKKGRASLHKNAVLNVFEGTHGDISGASTEEFTPVAIRERVVAALGTTEVQF